MRGASLPFVGALGAHLLGRKPMPPASWSLGLIGLGLFGVLQGPPSVAAAGSEAPTNRALAEPRQVEVTGGLRLLMAPPDDSGALAACVGYVVGIAVNDPAKRAGAIADLELRRENMARAYQERLGEPAQASRILDILNGDVAILCVSASNGTWEAMLSVAVEAIRPVTLTSSKWSSLVEQWRNHQGAAALVGDDPLQRQLQALTWLGSFDATVSIRSSIEPSSLIHFDDVARAGPAKPQRFVVGVSGQYQPRSVEQWIRANQLIREQTQSHARRPVLLSVQATPSVRQNPRFVHERVPHPQGHAWLFSWPISHLDAGRAASFDAVAQLIERRLNRTSKLGKESSISCELRKGRGFGSLVIELRSRTLVDLDTIDKWVFSTVEQLRTTSNEKNDLAQVAEWMSNQDDAASHPPLERAWTMTQEALLQKGTPGTPRLALTSEADVARLVDHDLNRRSVAEIFAEAQDPVVSPTHGRTSNSRNKKPANASRPQGNHIPLNHRGGRIYVIQNGESLQTIARKFHVTIGEIIRENGLHHPDQIRPGARIVIPQPATTAK